MSKKLFLIVLALGLSSCAGIGGSSQTWKAHRPEYEQKPTNPLAYYAIKKVAVVVLNATDAEVDIREAAQIYSVELQQFSGIQVYPAAVARAAVLEHKLRLPEQSHQLGRLLGVDAVIVGFITDYQPYDHPRVGVLLMVYPAADGQVPAESAVALTSLERVYDSDNQYVADQVRAFAEKRGSQPTPLAHRQYLLVMSNYMHFVADRSLRDLFAQVDSTNLWRSTPEKADKEKATDAIEDKSPDTETEGHAQPETSDPTKGNTDGP